MRAYTPVCEFARAAGGLTTRMSSLTVPEARRPDQGVTCRVVPSKGHGRGSVRGLSPELVCSWLTSYGHSSVCAPVLKVPLKVPVMLDDGPP